MKRARVFVVAGAVVAAWALLAALLSGLAHAPDVPMDRARTVALAHTPGTVAAERFARERGRWVYTFDIRPSGDPGTAVFVTVDADRGTVVAARSASVVAHFGP